MLYSLFNQINCRVLDDSINIFHRICGNWLFIVITTLEFICQFCIVQYGGLVFKCSVGGLTLTQWGWCLGLASSTFVISFLLKFIKLECLFTLDYKKLFCCCCKKSHDDAELNQHLMGEDEDDIEKAEKKIEMKEQNYGSSGGFLSNQSRGGN